MHIGLCLAASTLKFSHLIFIDIEIGYDDACFDVLI